MQNNKNFYEKQIIDLKNENQLLKSLLEEKNKEIENMSKKFEIERNEFIETMKSLREIIIQKENEKNYILFNQNNENNPLNKIGNNVKNKNFPYKNNRENIKKEIDSRNNYKNLKEKHMKDKNVNLTKNIKLNKKFNNEAKTVKNKTPLKIIGNKNQNRNIIKKNKSKKEINNRRKYKNNGCLTNYNEINNDIYNNFNNSNDESKQSSNEQNKEKLEYLYNINKYQQNIDKNNLLNLNSIRSDFLENPEAVETNNNIQNFNQSKNEHLNKINENIFILERNIPELTREYKNLLNKLNSNLYSEQKENIEININILETHINESKKKLFELKNYQQEILKSIYEG